MKRYFTFLALTLLCVLQSFAYDALIDGIYYNFNSTLGTATVTCRNYETWGSVSNMDAYSGDVVIPSSVEYNGDIFNVTSVGDYAFYYCSSLSSIEIPSSVISVGEGAFNHCSSLTKIDLPSVINIGGNAFMDCSALSHVNLSGVVSIGGSAFHNCNVIHELRIGSIEQWCKVNFGDERSNPTSHAYYGGGINLYIGNSDTPATDIVIPNTVTTVPDYAFFRTNIVSVSAPAVSTIGTFSFSNCPALTSIDFPSATSIGTSAFSYCTALTSVDLPSATHIGGNAFYQSYKITSANLSSVAYIGESAFYGPSLKSLRIGSEEQWCKVDFDGSNSNPLQNWNVNDLDLYIGSSDVPATDIVIPSTVTTIPDYAFAKTTITSVLAPAATSIGANAFYTCKSLKSVDLSMATAIGTYAFYGCSSLSSIEMPSSVTSIGEYTFSACTALWKIAMKGSVPPTVGRGAFTEEPSLVVPDDAYDDYTSAWTDYKSQISIASQSEREITVTAQDTESAIHKAVGEENLRNVLSLKVNGSINGYDIMILRNKMPNLRSLDLSEATIIGNDYEYYTGYHTTDNEIGPFAFSNLSNLISVKLPEVTAIQESAFSRCSNLREISLPSTLRYIANGAFYQCSYLPEIEIPGSVTVIGEEAFYYCAQLKNVIMHEGTKELGHRAFGYCGFTHIRFPETLTSIGIQAFQFGKLKELNLPPNLESVGDVAFEGNGNLEVVRLNPMLKNIGNYAFTSCNALKKVYTYTLEPTNILQDTYSAYKTADLYVPTPSYYTYYYNTQWSQFLSVNKTDEKYDFKSFYITKDYEMDNTTGVIGGKPNGELGENSGFINKGSETQELGTVTIRFNGNNGSSSIIANGNLTAEKIKVEITITGNKWHFFCFPFDVPLSGVSTSGNKAFVFRHYNAEKRATGASGWENLPNDQTVLKAGEGYIFQANGNTTLTVVVDNKTTFVGENVAAALKVQDASNVANASWNFKGNPGYAYFDIDDLGFTAPITVWDPNTNQYVALRPGDDDAFLHPFQAFFVQKPEGTDALTFNAEDRTTYLGSQKKMAKKVAQRRAASTVDNPRKLVNLTLTDGQTTDKTRVVFNDEKSMAYEMDCDAAKFASSGVPQLYSLDSSNTHYAINERPYGDGTVRLGFTAEKDGTLSIEAARMDTPCYLRDLELNITHDLSVGSYEFQSKKGVHEARFVLVNTKAADEATGIESINLNDIAEDAVIYDLQGRLVQRAQHGVYIINGKKLNVM